MKFALLSPRGVSAAILALLCAILSYGQENRVKSDLGRAFKKFDLVKTNPAVGPENRGAELSLAVRAGGRNFQLDVVPHDIRSSRYRTEDTGQFGITSPGNAGVKTFKGRIAGSGVSEVRLTIEGNEVEGFFEKDGERYFIEAADKYSTSAVKGDSVVYRAEDALIETPFYCETSVASQFEKGGLLVESSAASLSPSYRVIELATDADLAYVQRLGGAALANTEILGILNMVEGAYNLQLGLSISVVFQHTWTTADPFNGSMDAMLFSFTDHWNANYPNSSVPRDAAHLFSAKPAAVSRGLAWLGVICANPSYAYGISGHIAWAPGKFMVPAHEIGHNLGANHAEAAQSCANTVMNANLSVAAVLSFCAYSQTEVSTFVSIYGSCLGSGGPTPTPTPNPTPTPVPTPFPTPTPEPTPFPTPFPPTPTPTPVPTPFPTPTPPLPGTSTAFDFDGDGRADQGVFRGSTGTWYLNRSAIGVGAFQFGSPGDKAITADFDGDGRADPAVYRSGVWYFVNSASNTIKVASFGLPTDLPVPADLDGDRRADIVVFRPSDGRWYSLLSITGAYSVVHFGQNGDIPVPADFDGDGRSDINVFRPSNGVWYRLNSSSGNMSAVQFGLFGDKPVMGDFDGDQRADVSVFRPSTGTWYITNSGSGSYTVANFGLAEDMPTPADFDGDGRADIAVYRPTGGIWYRLDSSTGMFSAFSFGLSTDQPIAGFYLR